MEVNTVLGPIAPEQLGWTLPHEHIVVAWDGTLLDSTLDIDMPGIEAKAVEELKALKKSGVDSFIDMTTIEMGRDVEMLRRLADASGVQIIFCTGLFADDYGIPHYFRELSESELANLYVTEVTKGVGRTGIKAGVIKVATGGREATELEDRIMRAAAKAHVETGVPVLTHTGRGAAGDRQIEVLTEGGVQPEKIVVGHSDVSANLRYHLKLLKSGARVGFDRIGLPAFMPDEVRAQCIAALVRMGYLDQLTMSLDAHVSWIGRPQPLTVEHRHFTALADEFFPLLRKAGVTDEEIRRIMVDNVRRLFE